MSARILITGFEPFAEWRINSSWEGVVAFARERPEVTTARLPVDHDAATARLRATLDAVEPEICLLTGLARGDLCRIERLARRRSDAVESASEGAGPAHRFGVWDCTAALRRLAAADCPARDSTDAGLYVCETAYRAALDRRAERGAPTHVAFLHVPPLSATWPAARIARAIDAMLGDRLDHGRDGAQSSKGVEIEAPPCRDHKSADT